MNIFIFITGLMLSMMPISTNETSADRIKLETPDGQPLENAVVTFLKRNDVDIINDNKAPVVIGQTGSLFIPFVSAMTVGTEVTFTNQDKFRHHVYSFSKAKKFELSLFASDTINRLAFDNPGQIAIGCNIHDNMLAYLYVAAEGFPLVSGPGGFLPFSPLETGSYNIELWYPEMDKAVKRSLIIESGDDILILQLDVERVSQKPPSQGYF